VLVLADLHALVWRDYGIKRWAWWPWGAGEVLPLQAGQRLGVGPGAVPLVKNLLQHPWCILCILAGGEKVDMAGKLLHLAFPGDWREEWGQRAPAALVRNGIQKVHVFNNKYCTVFVY